MLLFDSQISEITYWFFSILLQPVEPKEKMAMWRQINGRMIAQLKAARKLRISIIPKACI